MVRIYLNRTPIRSYNYVPSAAQRRVWENWGSRFRQSHVFRLLKRIEASRARALAESAGNQGACWLRPYRRRLRRVFGGYGYRADDSTILILRYYLATCPPGMIPICVWLMSQCTDRCRLYEVKAFRDDPSPQVRKHVAKALRRLEAWALLAEMAKANPDDARIQWFAKAPITHRPFQQRLSDFVDNIDVAHAAEAAEASPMAYWSLYNPWQGRPAKSRALIREILWRIRRWVRGT